MEKIIKFGDWKSFKDYEPNDNLEYNINGGNLKIILKGKKYISVQFEKTAQGILPDTVYEVTYNLKVKNDKMCNKVMYGWYDEGGEALVKGYVKSGEKIISPEDAASLKISLNVHSYEYQECEFDGLTVYEKEKYCPKFVKLSTIALKYPIYPEKKAKEDNLSETVEKIDELCEKEHPDLIVLTETFYTRKCQLPLKLACLPEDSEPLNIIREKAKQYSTHIVFSYHEEENGVFFNTGYLIGRNGEILGKYRKTHITMAELEAGMAPGEEIKVFDTDIGKIGIAICWDIFFPEFVRKMQKMGVDIICNPTAGYRESRIFERARESGAYIIVSTVTDFKDSAIFNPFGEKIADASEHNGYAVATVDINKPYYVFWQSYPTRTSGKNVFPNEARWDLYI